MPLNSMDIQARQVLSNLRKHFGTQCTFQSDYESWNAICPIGIEVEVKWRDYFPELWSEFLATTPYAELNESQQRQLSDRCAEKESFLIPRLESTVSCGIDKGADRYWEFAFPPMTDVYILADQVNLLRQERLIPSGSHSLHLTIGNLRANKNSYYMLLLLEMMACDSNRIATGFHKENSKLSATWARKGLGGIFEKDATELKYGYKNAIELRTLALSDSIEPLELFKIASTVSDTIYEINTQVINNRTESWLNFVNKAQNILNGLGLADKNWKKPNLTPEFWSAYIENYDILRDAVLVAYAEEFMCVVDANPQKLVTHNVV